MLVLPQAARFLRKKISSATPICGTKKSQESNPRPQACALPRATSAAHQSLKLEQKTFNGSIANQLKGI